MRAFRPAGIMWLATATVVVSSTGYGIAQQVKPAYARTVWDGIYTTEQAGRGRTAYLESCAGCHGDDLRGKSTAPSLVEESFAFQWGDTSVEELYLKTRTLMPSDRPNSLPSQSYCDIIAFILQSNRFPAGEKELEADVEALRQILITAKRPQG